MYHSWRRLNRVARIVFLLSILISPIVTSQPALARSTPTNPSDLASPPTAVEPARSMGPASPDTLKALGIQRPQAANLTALSQQVAHEVLAHGLPASTTGPKAPAVGGLPNDLSGLAAQSASIMTLLNSGGSSNFRDVMLMANASGREDNVADHATKLADLTTANLPAGWMLTRAATSEHTFANGYTETVYYYGDSLGNVYVGIDPTGAGQVLTETVLNLPTLMNAFGSLQSDSQIVITGLGVNPVADLSSFANVNGSFSFFNGKIGEILYVAFWDTSGSGLNLNNNHQIIQSGVLAFPIADLASPASAPPGIQSNSGFPITVGGAFGVAFSVFANVAGLAVDDDGSIYFQQADFTNFTGANIVKVASRDKPGPGGFQDRSLATSGFVSLGTTLNPLNGSYGTSSGPAKQVNVATNFAGTSTTWGNIVALAAGPNNILYAAVARSFVPTDTLDVQNTEGLFANPAALGPTPSMIISFADTTGIPIPNVTTGFDLCTAPAPSLTGTLPVADGFADVEQAGLTLQPGVNNFRVFALGTGPDVRGQVAGATTANTIQVAFQVDDTIFSGLAVDEESKVYVISGGTPAKVGRDPSPNLGEILAFPDNQPFDRRADAVDMRGTAVPTPFTVADNTGDGQITRFDYIYYEAPLDQLSLTPTGLSGLARGFLLYLNRTRTDALRFTTLPNGQTQGDNTTNGPIFFEWFDASHQIAGGDDQVFPYRGDDTDGGGVPPIPGPLNGGFEFVYRQTFTPTQTLSPTTWNAFFLNSNGNITFGQGDTASVPSAASFLSGAPRLAGAWTHLNTSAHISNTNTFPVQAMGFANINHIVVRWINVPSSGFENCNSSNSFSVDLYDAGTGLDTNANQPFNPANPICNNAVPCDLQQGPTDLHFVQDANNLQPAGYHPRPAFSGNLCFNYGRMDLLGSPSDQTLVGATPGGQVMTTTPGINLSNAARAADLPFPAQQGLAIDPHLPASPYELFTAGVPATFTVVNGITTTIAAIPVFDLRQEGNDPALSTPVNQPDLNRGQVCFYNLANQTITFNPLADKIINASPVPLTATASSGLPVSFASLTPAVCHVVGTNVILVQHGQCIIRAGQAGNATFAPAEYVDRSFMVLWAEFLPIIEN